MGVSGHRPRGAGPVGAAAAPRSASARCTRSWAGVDAAAASSILPTDGRRIVRALEVVELTGQPFAASAPTIGAPRWDTAIVGLDWETTLLDERLAQRTDAMFADGLVDEVRTLLDRGLRDGVTASRALGYAQVIDDLDAGRRRRWRPANRRSSGPAATCAGSGRGFAATTASPGSTARPPAMSTTRCGYGGTYPDQVMFAKGHGTQNDFVLLPDLDGRLALAPAAVAALCDRRRGLGADGVLRVTTAGAAGEAGVFDRLPEGVAAGRLVHGLPQRRRVDRPDVRQRRAGVRALPAGQRAGEPRRVRRRLAGRARARWCCTPGTPPPPTSPSRWARPTSSAPARRSSAAGPSPGWRSMSATRTWPASTPT